MHIEELVLEGFKSYPVRTQITGWDSSFNAITGLNGSGKSNILDAICFVLGLTNMSQVRAANQQDLIYKRGQAGITKASVTIVFNNADKSKSPLGLHNCSHITVTRQIALPNISKYILNGHKSTQQHIQLLFQGVQLNINNPNFLIMQGRITKVLNMRPQEILGLVEEAAGTRMYEERKDKAKKTMDKKEKRVQEITALLNEEITPKLDTLREEKRSFLTYQKACSEFEKLSRILKAWEWKEATERVKRKETDVEKKQGDLVSIRAEREKTVKESDAAEKERKEAVKRREKEFAKGGKFQVLENQVKDLEKNVVLLRTQVEIKEGTIEDDDRKVVKLQELVNELATSLVQNKARVQELSTAYATIKQKHAVTEAALTNSEELLQTLVTGLSSANSANTSGGGYLGQLADAKARVAAASTEEEQARRKLQLCEKERVSLEVKWKKVETEVGDGAKLLEKARKEAESLKRKRDSTGWNEQREGAGAEEIRMAREKVRDLAEKRDAAKQNLSALDFQYSDPTPNFDRSKVKGLVASLITLQAQDYPKAAALEIAAGGRLFNVVVDDERTGSQLLQNGKLKKRVTIIPLNKINAFKATAQKLTAATKLSGNKAKLALTLVGYDDEVSAAMTYVFGDVLICDDAESAKSVTFNSNVAMKSVTIAGDVYDPSGTLSGGSAPSSGGFLVKVQEIKHAEEALKTARAALVRLEKEEEDGKGSREAWKKLSRELEMKEHEIGLLEEQLGGSNATRIGTEVETLKKTIEDLQKTITDAKAKQAAGNVECKKLEKDMDDFKSNKDGKIKELKADIAKQRAEVAKHVAIVKTHQKELQTAQLELEQNEKDIESSASEVRNANVAIEQIRKELHLLTSKLKDATSAFEKAEDRLKEERATLSRFDQEVKALEDIIKIKKEALTEADVAIKKIENDILAAQKDRTTAMNHVNNLEKQFPWIIEEKRSFGKPGGSFDFESMNIPQAKEKARELEEIQKGMKKKINPKVMNMIDTVEKKEASLKKNLATVLKDKTKIEETIEELDRYKHEALEKTWTEVSSNFGDIFGDLLPGNSAKLQRADPDDLSQGLEVKVQLGTVWKQSLTELSGGQRSLIALSLIMSLLQFKPAPMYILDEIDAALDLSHTQHIGEVIRKRFKTSQFIVVSLKDGLFNNANVLFRTKFRDGTSIVERTAQRSTSTIYSGRANKENEATPVSRPTRSARRVSES